jgi:exodeoxyribonuclease VII large subunit
MMEYEKKYLENIGKRMTLGCSRHFSEFVGKFKIMAEKIALHSPERQLRLGYSLVSFGGKIIRSVKDVKVGEEVDVKLSDGEMKTEIKKIL